MDAAASHLEEENRRLRRATEELSILNDLASAISSTMSLDGIVATIVEKCVKHLKVEQGAVMLLEEEEPDSPLRTMVRKMDSVAGGVPYRLGVQLTGLMLKEQRPLLVNDLQGDPRFGALGPEDRPTRSLLSVPLVLKGCLIGLLNVFNKRDEGWFTQEDQRLLSIIAVQSAQVIENARLYEEEQVLLRMQEELRLAGEIQMGLMPEASPQVSGFDIAGRCIPANHVGGDFFQYFERDGRIAIAIADVTGHAMDAAISVVMFSGILKSQMALGGTLQEHVERLNAAMHGALMGRSLIAFEMGELDAAGRGLLSANAGCPYPYHYRAATGDVVELQVDAYPLGARPDTRYDVIDIRLVPGDRVVFYSDGIPEAEDADDGQFGYERTAETVRQACSDDLSAEATIDRLLEAVAAFRGDVPQSDDMTCVVVRVEDT